MINTEAIEGYFKLIESLTLDQNEVFFGGVRPFRIITTRDIVEKFARDNNQEVGLLSINKHRNQMTLCDVVKDLEGNLVSYERIVPKDLKVNEVGVAVIAELDRKFLIIRNFRHPTGRYHWELIRGCVDKELSDEDPVLVNAQAELAEEGGLAVEMSQMQVLGSINPDNGLTSASVAIVHARTKENSFSAPKPDALESITDRKWVTRAELHQMIRDGEITEAITLAAVKLLDVSAYNPGPVRLPENKRSCRSFNGAPLMSSSLERSMTQRISAL